jgi:hypothetical protein
VSTEGQARGPMLGADADEPPVRTLHISQCASRWSARQNGSHRMVAESPAAAGGHCLPVSRTCTDAWAQ